MRVLIAGDLHGNHFAAKSLVSTALKYEVEHVWQVGDFGYWPRYRPDHHNKFMDILDGLGLPIYFADGNHEDHEVLDTTFPHEGVTQLRDFIFHVHRGTVLHIASRRVIFFGGAVSVDRTYRTPGVDWFHQEIPTMGQLNRTLALDPVDIVVAHDVPAWVDFGYPPHEHAFWPAEELRASDRFRALLSEIATTLNPSLWLAGHHHRRLTFIADGFPRVEVLNCDGYPGTFLVLDTETGEIEG